MRRRRTGTDGRRAAARARCGSRPVWLARCGSRPMAATRPRLDDAFGRTWRLTPPALGRSENAAPDRGRPVSSFDPDRRLRLIGWPVRRHLADRLSGSPGDGRAGMRAAITAPQCGMAPRATRRTARPPVSVGPATGPNRTGTRPRAAAKTGPARVAACLGRGADPGQGRGVPKTLRAERTPTRAGVR